MALKENIREEFKRGPVTVIATVLGVLVALLALFVAWLQYAGAPVSAASNATPQTSHVELKLSNLLVVVAFFLAATLSAASLVRILDRAHPFPAMFLSVPAAVSASFFTMLVLTLAPPRPLTPESLDAARDTVFWATLFIFVAINGASAIRDVPTRKAPNRPSDDAKPGHHAEPDGLTSLFGALLMLAVWGALVSAGLSKLTTLFLK